jgi:predicted phosphodiesterase
LVRTLIFGHVTHDPYAFLFNNDCGLLRPGELALVRNEDEQALLTQLSQTCWEAVDIVENARRKMMDYLGWESDK